MNFPLSNVSTDVKQDETIAVPSKHLPFVTSEVPQMTVDNDTDGVHVPSISNFPDLDLIWKTGEYVFGVEVFTSFRAGHEKKAWKFQEKVKDEVWFQNFTVCFIYLCPDENTKMKVKHKYDSSKNFNCGLIKVGFITIAQWSA